LRRKILHYSAAVSGVLITIFGPAGAIAGQATFPKAAITYPLLIAVDAQRGELIFHSRCSMCHTVAGNSPYNKMGPDLHSLFGRKAGSLQGYEFSAALRNSGIIWREQTLNAYLQNPHKKVPGVKMPFLGISDKTVRADVIDYLRQATK
jgi:cytochrome c